MKRLILLLSVLTVSLSYVSLSEGCYDPEFELRSEIYYNMLSKKRACHACINRKVDYEVRTSDLVQAESEQERARRLSTRAAVYNCLMCDKPAAEQTPQSAQTTNAPVATVAGTSVVKKCVATDSPSMASFCPCHQHKKLHSSYKK